MRKAIILLCAVLGAVTLRAQGGGVDTVWVSSRFTTHIMFPTDLIYADLSNKAAVDALLVGKSEDVLAVKARAPFSDPCNITAMESNGTLRTYILMYRDTPSTLVIDEKHGVYDAAPEYVYISRLYTSHMVFSSDISYVDLSDMQDVTAAVVEKSPNVLAIKALDDFGARTSSVTVLEADGWLHTYVLRYGEHPEAKIMNMMRKDPDGNRTAASRLRNQDAPLLKEVLGYPQQLFHIATRKERISVVCENIFSYSDITYIVLRIENGGGVSFEAGKTGFVIGSRHRGKKIVEEAPLLVKNSVGSLTAAPGETSRMAFSFDKVTLSPNQVLRVCVYEENGRREFFLTLSNKDVNLAVRPDPVR